jgi:hypothetical protein
VGVAVTTTPDAGPDAGPLSLPRSLGTALRVEFGRAFHAPYEVPIVVAVNGILMAGLWFLAPQKWKNALFSLHGPLAFALVLAGWMLSDVPATNVLGPDARRVGASLGDPVMFRRLLYAKNLALWTLVCPLCIVIAVAIGTNHHDDTAMVVAIVALVVVPFGPLAISAWVGIRWPYHPIPLKQRWAARGKWGHMLVRWVILILTPYGLVPLLAALFMAPTVALWGVTAQHGLTARLSDAEFAEGIALACGLSVVGAVLGHRIGDRWARRRHETLRTYLADPSLG